MIYATHKLYDCWHRVTSYKVVETDDGLVSHICDFESERHSMQWYDAIVLSSKNNNNSFFESFVEVLEFLCCNGDDDPIYAYGVTYDGDRCILSRLI